MAKKLLFGSVPGLRGRFPYYGHTVFFPPKCHLFERACVEGIYERDTTNLILSLIQPGTTYFDAGANIGLLSVPVLAMHPSVKVVSIEANPQTLLYLKKTHASADRRQDWTIIEAAVGAADGEADFWSGSAAMGAFDGLRDTGRGGAKRPIRVPVQSLDKIWRTQGSPAISVIKMDIEGAEYFALQGATEITSREKPIFVIEWTEKNLRPYEVNFDKILELCSTIGYSVYASPNLAFVNTNTILRVAMAQTETFILVPEGQRLNPMR
jgi:FkbM family methyltransferase